jgi:hypothetical protein
MILWFAQEGASSLEGDVDGHIYANITEAGS